MKNQDEPQKIGVYTNTIKIMEFIEDNQLILYTFNGFFMLFPRGFLNTISQAQASEKEVRRNQLFNEYLFETANIDVTEYEQGFEQWIKDGREEYLHGKEVKNE